LSKNADAKEAKIKWPVKKGVKSYCFASDLKIKIPSGDERMKPLGARTSTICLMTIVADSKH